ncbi:SWIM zinc finger family protein [Candidatus Woesearchaeota archaeon]|nr:SWIM zinc finger family protein [Candidatus Woesearchaeota archaeon]
MNIKKEGNKYAVESGSKKGIFYNVDIERNTCSCPGFMFRMRPAGKVCKHIGAVKEYLEKRGKVVSRKNEEKLDEVLDFVRRNENIESVKLLELFSEELINDMIDKGFLIEKNGRIEVLE